MWCWTSWWTCHEGRTSHRVRMYYWWSESQEGFCLPVRRGVYIAWHTQFMWGIINYDLSRLTTLVLLIAGDFCCPEACGRGRCSAVRPGNLSRAAGVVRPPALLPYCSAGLACPHGPGAGLASQPRFSTTTDLPVLFCCPFAILSCFRGPCYAATLLLPCLLDPLLLGSSAVPTCEVHLRAAPADCALGSPVPAAGGIDRYSVVLKANTMDLEAMYTCGCMPCATLNGACAHARMHVSAVFVICECCACTQPLSQYKLVRILSTDACTHARRSTVSVRIARSCVTPG